MEKRETKLLKKIICFILSLTMILSGIITLGDKVSYANVEGITSTGGEPPSYIITNSGTHSEFILVSWESNYFAFKYSFDIDETNQLPVPATSIEELKINGSASLDVRTSVTVNSGISLESSAILQVSSGTLNAYTITGGTIINNSTIDFYGFMTSPSECPISGTVVNSGSIKCPFIMYISGLSIQNYGSITSSSIDLTGIDIEDSDDAEYSVTSQFKNGTTNLKGTVVTNEDATISSAGGSFYLKVDGNKKLITGTFTNQKAGDLIYEESDFEYNGGNYNLGTIYSGQDVDAVVKDEDKISVKTGYDTTKITYDYYKGTTLLDEAPTENGSYTVKVTAPATGVYRPAVTKTASFTIASYPTPSPAYTLSGTEGNPGYYISNVDIIPASGYKISRTIDGTYSSKLTLTEEGEYVSGDSATKFYLRKAEAPNKDATTAQISASETIFIDKTAPSLEEHVTLDGEYREKAESEFDGAEFHAKKAELVIVDNYSLDTVTVNGGTEGVVIDSDLYFATVTLKPPAGTSKIFTVKAVDSAGLEKEYSITVEYLKDVPTTSISMSDVSYGTDYALPTVTTDSDQDSDSYEYYYKTKDADESTYTTVKPVDIGSYDVKVVIPSTDNYTETSAETSFDIAYLTAPSPLYTVSGTKGKNNYYTTNVTINAPEGFKITDEADGTFKDSLVYRTSLSNIYLKKISDGALTNAIPFTETFLIDKAAPQVVCSAKDQYGNEVTISDGGEVHAKTVSFDVVDENLVSVTADGKEFTVNDGIATVTLAADDGIARTVNLVAEDIAGNTTDISFTIEYIKTVATATVSITDTYVGVAYAPVFETNSGGTATFYYKKDGTSDDTYTIVAPDSVGKYYVQARVPATEDYTAVNAENTFEINFLPSPSPAYTLSGEKDKNGNFADEIIINAPEGYEIAKGFAETYADSVTYTDGLDKIYLRRISDGALTAAVKFEEDFMNEATVTVSAGNTYLGLPVKPVATTNSIGDITYYYKDADAPDTAYTTHIPDEVGKYTVQARVAATKYYPAVTAETTFEINYLPAPEVTYALFGTKGNNDYYKSDVDITAPEGYLISDKLTGPYKPSIVYTEGMDKIYLKKTDGSLTGAIDFNEKLLIDNVSPSVALQGVNQSGKSVTIKDGLSTYADTLMFAITDDNLLSVTINDDPVTVSEGRAELILDSLSNTKTFIIAAEDKAGNIVRIKITLKANWLENMVIPVGASINLVDGQEYFFAEGNIYHVNNDTTDYYGGNAFYVTEPGDYTFSEN